MRRQLDKQLKELNDELLEMGGIIENAISKAISALKLQDAFAAREVVAGDDRVDSKERDIEALCLKILLQQQPVARDLRQVSTALKMITDMERIGDHAADISEITEYLSGQGRIKNLERIPLMADAAVKMLSDAIDAFVEKNLELAEAVIEYDDVVDGLFVQVKDELIELIAQDAKYGSQALDILMVAKYLERIGDHAQNIAEWVVFSITGRHKDAQIL